MIVNYCVVLSLQGRSQEFAKGGDNSGGLRDGSPPAGSRGRAPVRPRSRRQMWIR